MRYSEVFREIEGELLSMYHSENESLDFSGIFEVLFSDVVD
jgi:hypothetical protein